MSIVITSGAVRGHKEVTDRVNRSVLKGIKRGIQDTLDEFLPIIAFMPDSKRALTGRTAKGLHMREAFEDAVNDIIDSFSRLSSKRILRWSQIKVLTIAAVDYAQYHFRARGFYVNPSTAGTKPMRFSSFKIRAVRNVRLQIFRALNTAGLETRAKFTVG
ncbi:hypothetical protein LCGC14_1861850 [marine sediment metagenome]|uniref:Uncharacterized protein n=1 Tax=marine sediment metagenome TaxID=412755 RepID=A0A0F9ILP1_9ZZZZ